jgi:hypothetical protein
VSSKPADIRRRSFTLWLLQPGYRNTAMRYRAVARPKRRCRAYRRTRFGKLLLEGCSQNVLDFVLDLIGNSCSGNGALDVSWCVRGHLHLPSSAVLTYQHYHRLLSQVNSRVRGIRTPLEDWEQFNQTGALPIGG